MPRARRARGILLRLILNRPLAVCIGFVVAAPGAGLLLRDFSWETPATEGAALLSVTTGIAIVWSGLSGRTADWVE